MVLILLQKIHVDFYLLNKISFFLSNLKSLEEFVLNILPGLQTPTYIFQFSPVVPCQ